MNRRHALKAFASLALCPLCAAAGRAAEAPHWTYEGKEGPDKWGSLGAANKVCGVGAQQSPIDIVASTKADLPKLDIAFNFDATLTGVDLAACRVQLGGQLVLDQRLIELVRGGQSPPSLEVIGRGSEPGPFETEARVRIVGVQPNRFGVFDNRPIVVLAMLGLAAVTARRGRGAAARDERPSEKQERRPQRAAAFSGRMNR